MDCTRLALLMVPLSWLRGRTKHALAGMTIGLAVFLASVRLPASMVERTFSRTLYPPAQRVVTGVSNVVPVALLDVMLVVTLLWLVRLTIRAHRCWRDAGARSAVQFMLGRLLMASALLYLGFALGWGLNYQRVALLRKVDLRSGATGRADLERLGRRAVSALNGLYQPAHLAGWETPEWRSGDLVSASGRVQMLLGAARPARPGRLKHSFLGPYFRWASIDGMINPYGLDVIANPDLLPYERPFVAAHEWAHLAGYADESEASFVGFLTCMSGGVTAQYSGYLFLYWQVASEADAEVRRVIDRDLASGPRADLDAIVTRIEAGRFRLLQGMSWKVYDRYLKANRVGAGIKSYGLVLDLIARATSEPDWKVRPRESPDGLSSP